MDTTPPQGAAMGQPEGSKLPPVLAKLMDNLSSSSYRSPQVPNAVSSAAAPPVNVQELLSSIMVSTRWPLPVLVLLLAAFWSVSDGASSSTTTQTYSAGLESGCVEATSVQWPHGCV